MVLLATLGACVTVLLVACIRARWITDDALITFRYVDNLIAGDGLVYNVGERLEAFSSPLFVLLLTLPAALGADLFATAQVLGIAFTVAELLLIFLLLRGRKGLPLAAILGGTLFVSERMVTVWATGGLETSLFSLLVFASFTLSVLQGRAERPDRYVLWAGIVHGLAAWARPEGIALLPLYLAITSYLGRGDPAWKRRALRVLLIVVTAVGALLLLRYLYYGAILPHTFRAKIAGVPTSDFGPGYVAAFARRVGLLGPHLVAWLVAAIAFAAALRAGRRDPEAAAPEQRRQQADLSAIAAIGALYVVAGLAIAAWEGGDYMTDFRLLRPFAGVIAAVAAALCGRAFAAHGRPGVQLVALAAAVALLISHGLRQARPVPVFSDAPPPAEHLENNAVTRTEAEEFRAAIERFARPGDKLLTDVTGLKGYGHQFHTVDATGLTSREIEGNFYLRDMWATEGYRDRLPGHARWPKVEFLQREGFAMITPKIAADGHDVAEVTRSSHRRYRRYPFLHVTLALDDGRFLRFFTTLPADELAERGRAGGLDLCWRAPLAPRPSCLDGAEPPGPPHPPKPAMPPGLEARSRAPARTPEEAARQYFGAMDAADCAWLRATTAGAQARADARTTCADLEEQLEHLRPVRLRGLDWERPGREPAQRLLQARFFLEGKDRVKILTVEEIDGEWKVVRF